MNVDYLRKSESSLLSPPSSSSSSSSSVFICQMCGKSYAWKVSLSRHLREECGLPPMNICFCGKRFKQRSSYKRHVETLHKKIKFEFTHPTKDT